jgi:hypothetical protein
MRLPIVRSLLEARADMIEFLFDSLLTAIIVLAFLAIFAFMVAISNKEYSFGPMLFSAIFWVALVVLAYGLYNRTYSSGLFGTVVVTPILAIILSIGWRVLRGPR